VAGTPYQHTVIEIQRDDLKFTQVSLTQSITVFTMKLSSNIKLALCFAGIFGCYFYYGIVQEKITRGTYGAANERYFYTLFLVFTLCLINALFGTGILVATGAPSDETPKHLFAICGVTYVGAMLASNMSLKWVNYPTQVLGKSCKPIPVMLLGVFLAHKKYNLVKYLSVLLITIGIALFMYKDGKSDGGGFSLGIGEILLLVSLTMDGLTGVMQEKMRAHNTRAHYMMMNMNLSALVLLSAGLLITGEAWEATAFCIRNPSIIPHLVTFGLASAMGQNFIFITVTEFGPLMCSIMTTTRKFFTILGSVIFFGNTLIARQWLGTGIVFSGLVLDNMYGKTIKKLA